MLSLLSSTLFHSSACSARMFSWCKWPQRCLWVYRNAHNSNKNKWNRTGISRPIRKISSFCPLFFFFFFLKSLYKAASMGTRYNIVHWQDFQSSKQTKQNAGKGQDEDSRCKMPKATMKMKSMRKPSGPFFLIYSPPPPPPQQKSP